MDTLGPTSRSALPRGSLKGSHTYSPPAESPPNTKSTLGTNSGGDGAVSGAALSCCCCLCLPALSRWLPAACCCCSSCVLKCALEGSVSRQLMLAL
jgi:hypothetical protein